MINEKLSLADHTDFVSKKVNQRLGVLRRIKHLLPKLTMLVMYLLVSRYYRFLINAILSGVIGIVKC